MLTPIPQSPPEISIGSQMQTVMKSQVSDIYFLFHLGSRWTVIKFQYAEHTILKPFIVYFIGHLRAFKQNFVLSGLTFEHA